MAKVQIVIWSDHGVTEYSLVGQHTSLTQGPYAELDEGEWLEYLAARNKVMATEHKIRDLVRNARHG